MLLQKYGWYASTSELLLLYFKTEEAEKYYKLSYEAIKDKATHFNYIDCLRSNKKYEEANAEMKKFASKYTDDGRSALFQKRTTILKHY